MESNPSLYSLLASPLAPPHPFYDSPLTPLFLPLEGRSTMPRKAETMSIADATMTMLLLAEWIPPEGLTVTISTSSSPGALCRRVVNVILSAIEDQFCVINVGGVPDADALDALTRAAWLVLQAAWDQPACLGLGPAPEPGEWAVTVPADLMAPGGPLNLRSTPHPIYDTTRFGRDL